MDFALVTTAGFTPHSVNWSQRWIFPPTKSELETTADRYPGNNNGLYPTLGQLVTIAENWRQQWTLSHTKSTGNNSGKLATTVDFIPHKVNW